jgi:hypothetical protein
MKYGHGMMALTAGLVMGVGLLVSGCAGQNQSAVEQQAPVTGSYVPQNAQVHGPVTNGPNDVRVLSQSELQRSGGATPGQALQELGATH